MAPPPLHSSVLLLLLLLLVPCSAQVGDSCSSARDCGTGLYCGSCPAASRTKPSCIRDLAIQPTSIVKGLPFNRYSWLVTHNSFSILGEPSLTGVERVTFYNQEDSVTNQLRNGVRGLMLDMYDFNDDVWLCHSLQGQCYNFTAFGYLTDIAGTAAVTPTRSIDPAENLRPLGLRPCSQKPDSGCYNKHKSFSCVKIDISFLVVMAAGDPGIVPGSCPNRKESQPLNSRSPSLFLQNYFPTIPVQNEACKENSELPQMAQACYAAAGNRIPNFLAVNFYMRSDGDGVFDVQDRINGLTLCGCNTIAACQIDVFFINVLTNEYLQAGAPMGACKNIGAPNQTPSSSSSVNGNVYSGTIEFKTHHTAGASDTSTRSSFVLLLSLLLTVKLFASFMH
ncbi:PI-PLC X domain-containing protein [Dichanthelium oligosanthes]|uniref:PI-PLC X domain-containing protein n=1 Tax=Dichanthelium oligosanthes TaxID=888268 RepID=A0A1E5W9P0_9POAL|nr:PI-PLC X domain-containing protein [Dichanthelium oligosanthes]